MGKQAEAIEIVAVPDLYALAITTPFGETVAIFTSDLTGYGQDIAAAFETALAKAQEVLAYRNDVLQSELDEALDGLIVAFPAATAVIVPSVTVAMVESLLSHVRLLFVPKKSDNHLSAGECNG